MNKITQIVAAAAILTASPALAETPKWKISESNGTVNILRSGVSKIAISGGSLRAGDIVSTAGKSRAVLVRGQEYVVVSPNSRVQISAPKQTGGIMQFFQEIGNAVFRIDKKATPHFGVETPYLAAVVKGTTFSVTVTNTGSAVQVTEGAVQVSTLDGGATHLLSPGMIGMVANDQRFKLTIAGAESGTVISPNAPASNVTPPAGDENVKETEIAAASFDAVISTPISDTPVSLSGLTGGLVTGGSTNRAPVQIAARGNNSPNQLGLNNNSSNNNPGTFGNGNGPGSNNGNSNNSSDSGSENQTGGKGGLSVPPLVSGGNGNASAGSNSGNGNAGLNSGNSNGNGNSTANSNNANNGAGNGNASAGSNSGNGNAGLNSGNSNGNGNSTANSNNANAGGGNGNGNNGGGKLKEFLTALYNGYQDYKNGNGAGAGTD